MLKCYQCATATEMLLISLLGCSLCSSFASFSALSLGKHFFFLMFIQHSTHDLLFKDPAFVQQTACFLLRTHRNNPVSHGEGALFGSWASRYHSSSIHSILQTDATVYKPQEDTE